MNRFDNRLFSYLFFAFIAATVAGTLSHEWGHYIVAKYYGFNARINYASAVWSPANPHDMVAPEQRFFITLGGPVQTLLTGTLGLLLLFARRKTFIATDTLSSAQWAMIFLSLFWLRSIFNGIIWVGGWVINGKFSLKGDEIKIAAYLHLPNWSIVVPAAMTGIIVLLIRTFRFIPAQQRFTFIVAGLTGGVARYILWIMLLGKYIMP